MASMPWQVAQGSNRLSPSPGEAPALGTAARPMRLLLIEDDPLDAGLTLDAIARHGVAVSETVVVDDATELERRLGDFRPDVIVSDYTLPGFSGEDALRAAVRLRPEVPFIFVSGMLGEDRAVELLKAGAWDYVLKDRLTRLGPAIERALAESAAAVATARLQADRKAALDGARQSEDQLRAALRRLGALQELTAAFAATLTAEDVVRVLTTTLSGAIGAELCLAALLDPERGVLTLDGIAAVRAGLDPTRILRSLDDPAGPVAAVLREGHIVHRPEPDGAGPAAEGDWPFPPSTSWSLVPFGARRPLGLLLLRWRDRRELSGHERSILTIAATQGGQALERARLYEAQVHLARALQHALLPPRLPEVAGLRCAARYLTAHGDAVGGDWYDAFQLPNGATGLVMGDVEGHSADAAAVMGQVRNALRAYAWDGHAPAEIMRKLNGLLHSFTDRLVTCCYAEVDPGTTVVTVVRAGHPPAIVVGPSGRAYQLGGPAGLPLGVDTEAVYEEHTHVLSADARLVMFTDGLADGERAVHPRMEALLTLLADHVDDEPEALADVLVGVDAPAAPLVDDAALLVVQFLGSQGSGSGRVAARSFQSTPAAAPIARHFLRDVLGDWCLDDLQEAAALAVSELITNAVLHTAGTVRLTLRRLDDDRVWVGVTDDSDRMPTVHEAADDDIAGRGLAIVEHLADVWGVDPVPAGGKSVWLVLSAGPTSAPDPDQPAAGSDT